MGKGTATNEMQHDPFRLARVFASDALERATLQYQRMQDGSGSQFSCDLHFFLTSVRDVHQAALIVKRLEPDGPISEAIAQFEAVAENARAMRNVGDHIDAYVLGKGHLESVTHRDLCVASLNNNGDLRWRGGEINVHQAREAAQVLYVAVSDASQADRAPIRMTARSSSSSF